MKLFVQRYTQYPKIEYLQKRIINVNMSCIICLHFIHAWSVIFSLGNNQIKKKPENIVYTQYIVGFECIE